MANADNHLINEIIEESESGKMLLFLTHGLSNIYFSLWANSFVAERKDSRQQQWIDVPSLTLDIDLIHNQTGGTKKTSTAVYISLE